MKTNILQKMIKLAWKEPEFLFFCINSSFHRPEKLMTSKGTFLTLLEAQILTVGQQKTLISSFENLTKFQIVILVYQTSPICICECGIPSLAWYSLKTALFSVFLNVILEHWKVCIKALRTTSALVTPFIQQHSQILKLHSSKIISGERVLGRVVDKLTLPHPPSPAPPRPKHWTLYEPSNPAWTQTIVFATFMNRCQIAKNNFQYSRLLPVYLLCDYKFILGLLPPLPLSYSSLLALSYTAYTMVGLSNRMILLLECLASLASSKLLK